MLGGGSLLCLLLIASDIFFTKLNFIILSKKEIEIRSAVIYTIELIKKELKLKRNIDETTININNYLWSVGVDVKMPFHRTRTTSY